jgi:hypothetical protein
VVTGGHAGWRHMGVGGAGIGGGRTGYWKWAHGVLEVGVMGIRSWVSKDLEQFGF